jgi:hypothetical protein
VPRIICNFQLNVGGRAVTSIAVIVLIFDGKNSAFHTLLVLFVWPLWLCYRSENMLLSSSIL